MYCHQHVIEHNSAKAESSISYTRFFFISFLFISIIRLKSGRNQHNLSNTKDQILPQDEQKNGENQA